jgi:hypothetical protein
MLSGGGHPTFFIGEWADLEAIYNLCLILKTASKIMP